MITKKKPQARIKTSDVRSVSNLTKNNNLSRKIFFRINFNFQKQASCLNRWRLHIFYSWRKRLSRVIFIIKHGMRVGFQTFNFYNNFNCYEQFFLIIWWKFFHIVKSKPNKKSTYEWLSRVNSWWATKYWILNLVRHTNI